MGLTDYQTWTNINESVRGDITLPMLKQYAKRGKDFDYQEAIDNASGGDEIALEHEAVYLQGVLNTRGSGEVYSVLGENMVAAMFEGENKNTAGEDNAIFYDVQIGNSYYSVKTSFAKGATTPVSCFNNSPIKRNSILSIFSSSGGYLKNITSADKNRIAYELYQYVEGSDELKDDGTQFGISGVYIRDNMFQIYLSNAITRSEILSIIKDLWDKIKQTVKEPINEHNVIELFLNPVIPIGDKDKLKDTWSGENLVKYFGKDENNTVNVKINMPENRGDVLKYLAKLPTNVLVNFAKSQGYENN
jgi:hypothetical protein